MKYTDKNPPLKCLLTQSPCYKGTGRIKPTAICWHDIEVLIKNNHITIAGELTSSHKPDYAALVLEVFDRIGKERLGYDPRTFDLRILVEEQSPDIAMGVDKGGAGDQGMMMGYATNETPELLPIPFVVATKFLEILQQHPSHMFRADAKAQVSFDYDSGRITTFLCSVQHSPDVEPTDFRHIIERSWCWPRVNTA